jgi:hypothetical protein
MLPIAITAQADPAPSPTPAAPSSPADPNAAAPPADPNAAAPPADPNAAAPPADPNAAAPPADPLAPAAPAPDANRINVPAGGFSYVLPGGWTVGDASRLSYGQAVLLKTSAPGSPPATDTTILLGKLDMKLFAGAETDNTRAAIRLSSDMGEFYMPFPGTRINQETVPLATGSGMTGTAAFYEVKFTDANKPNGQIWAAAIGQNTPRQGNQPAVNERYFVVWLGSFNNPVDKAAAKALAESIRPYALPAPAPAPEPTAPEGTAPGPAPAAPGAAPAPGEAAAPSPAQGRAPVGVPVPVAPVPEMTPPA